LAAAWPAAAQERPAWKTGPALRKQLEASVSVTWKERPLRDGLVNLSRSEGIAIFLDRRIDPDQPVELSVVSQSVEKLLQQLAAKNEARVGYLGPVVYLGPPATASKVSTLAVLRRQEAATLPNEAKLRLLRTEAWKWDELAEPRNLLAELGKKANVTIVDAELVPHDLWPAADLPPMAWLDRLTLVLAGFGLTFEISDGGAAVRLVPIPEEVLVEKTYTPKGEAAAAAAQLRRILPEAKISIEGGKLIVAAVQDDHDQIQRLLSGQSVKTTTVTQGEKRFSMTVENQAAGSVVKTVANQLGKEMKYDPQLVEKLQTKISLEVKDVTLDELLKRALEPLKLGYRIDDAALEVVPAEE
jgi:hypothetical protein